MALSFHHVQVAMPAGGEEEARRFYRDVLRLEEIDKPAALATRGGCWFRIGDAELHLGVETEFRPARKAHPALLVVDLDRVEARLREAGRPVDRDTDLAGHRRVYTTDPFGNRIELLEARTVSGR
jgi:catechol 2,3-dioxygenase-like lactoylglutathione lyase family enzyme